MLQQDQPADYVIATGVQHSVRDFVAAAAWELGIGLRWQGQGADEVAMAEQVSGNSKVRVGQVLVRVDASFLRPSDVPNLLGDTAKARRELGWAPRSGFGDLVREMVAHDLVLAQREARGD